uniref:Macrophage colony-stimulating factor 1 n=1 Tax=Salvator merianae TaxID=96440 RepID=A0A8D0DZK2_SALMN
MTSHIQLALLLFVVCASHKTVQENTECRRLISDFHIENMSALIDSQMKTSCLQTYNYVDEKLLDNTVCFLKAAYEPLKVILDGIIFKKNTSNFKTLEQMKRLHFKLGLCLEFDDEEERTLATHCTKNFSLTSEEMLQRVSDYFKKAKQQLSKGSFSYDCSSTFQKCSDSQRKKTFASGVVTDQNCKCPSTSPTSGRGFEPFSSIADQLDSKETAASTFQLHMLPATIQTQGGSESSTRSRMSRSTRKGQGTAERMDFRVGTGTVTSSPSEELVLAAESQGATPVSMSTVSLLDPTRVLQPRSSRLRNIPSASSPSQQHTESTGLESPIPGSGSGSSQAQPNKFAFHHPLLYGLTKSSHGKLSLLSREVDETVLGLEFDHDPSDISSSSTVTSTSLESLESVDSSKVPFNGRWVAFPSSDPVLSHVLGLEDPISATQLSTKRVVTTESPSSPRQVAPESYSRGEQDSRGRAPEVQQSTQVRERRADQGEGLAKYREPKNSVPGPSFDLSFIPSNTDKRTKKPEPRSAPIPWVTNAVVPSVLGILLAVGSLLLYLYIRRIRARRQPRRNENNIERQEEGRPLNREQEQLELRVQEEL